MGGLMGGFVKKMLFSVLIGVLLLGASGYSLYLGKSISDIFIMTLVGATILLSIFLYKFKDSSVKNPLLWNFFEIIGYGLFTLILCLATANMFHHFVMATTSIIIFFKVVPSMIYTTLFNKKH